MKPTELKKILNEHAKWLGGAGGARAYLRGANLQDTNLQGANLQGANLQDADLRDADLRDADLQNANLRGADLQDSNLRGSDLRDSDLRGADLRDSDLQNANLQGSNLQNAYLAGSDLRGSDLTNAKLPHFQIPQEGGLTVWKAGSDGCVIKLYIPAAAKRTASLIGRKCRAEYVKVLAIFDCDGRPEAECMGWFPDIGFVYRVGETVHPDKYDDDIRVECSHGIHFFLTREEAEEWG